MYAPRYHKVKSVMVFQTCLSWREPLTSDWRVKAAEILALYRAGANQSEIDAAGNRLRRLSAMRLGDGERLVLRRIAKAARSLNSPPSNFRAFRILLVSNRSLGFFGGNLEVAGLARGLLIDVVDTEFGAVSSLAFDPAISPPDGPFDAVFLLQDEGAFQSRLELLDAKAEQIAVDEFIAKLEHTIGALSCKVGAPVIVATIASSADTQISSSDIAVAGSKRRITDAVNSKIAEFAAAGSLIPFDLANISARIGAMSFFDPVRFHQAKVPFSLHASPVVADGLAALIAALTGRSGRVLVLDLDNTLWGGVVADDGLHGIRLGQGSAEGEAFLAIQEFAQDLRRRGIVLAVCSKNTEAIAREVFNEHPDMLLRNEEITVFVANFNDKASNLVRIAETLDLGLSSLVFIDDNPAERERVRSSLPFVMVPELGEDPAEFVRTIVASGYFEHLPLNTDDVRRASTYEARTAAKSLLETAKDYSEYLHSLEMVLSIAPFDIVSRARIAQLVQKSNQFNLTTKRYTIAELEAIEKDPNRLSWQIRLEDRFADHGMIGVVIVEAIDEAWLIDTWIMSCRVLQRGVEDVVMDVLKYQAVTSGASALRGAFYPTSRNSLVMNFYDQMGFVLTNREPSGASFYEFDLRSSIIKREDYPMAVDIKFNIS